MAATTPSQQSGWATPATAQMEGCDLPPPAQTDPKWDTWAEQMKHGPTGRELSPTLRQNMQWQPSPKTSADDLLKTVGLITAFLPKLQEIERQLIAFFENPDGPMSKISWIQKGLWRRYSQLAKSRISGYNSQSHG